MVNEQPEAENVTEKFDDYPLDRVPTKERKHWFGIATMRFGQMTALSQFLLGAALGYGMPFWEAFWAITLGAVILEVAAILVGIAGMKEGMNTTLLVRWTGFGKWGAMILSLVITISLVGWFGIQNAVFAEGLAELLGGPLWLWSIATGVLLIVIVIFGILSLGFTAYITVPLFLLVVLYSFVVALSDHSLGTAITEAAPGPSLSFAVGTTMVAGSFIAGAIITPDMSRYNRSVADVIKQTIVGITLGEYCIGLIGVLLAHFAQTSNVIDIVMSTSGVLGTIVLITATVKINDWNLYSSALGFVNFLDTAFNKQVSRVIVTIVIGLIGTLLSVLGILSQFAAFLSLLGVALPPVAGILIVEYFIIRRYKSELDETRQQGTIPKVYERWNPITLVAWLIGFVFGEFVPWGIPSINSIIVAGLVYGVVSIIVNRKGIVRFGEVQTHE